MVAAACQIQTKNVSIKNLGLKKGKTASLDGGVPKAFGRNPDRIGFAHRKT